MPNYLEAIAVVQKELDKVAIETATSGWMEDNAKQVKYSGGSECKIPVLTMDGLGDYDRQTGFADGDVDLRFETKQFTQDRARKFSLDENEVDESNFILMSSSVMGEFQRTHVIPEIDAYRYSAIAQACMTEGRVTSGYTPTESTVLQQLVKDIGEVRDVVGDDTPLVVTMSSKVYDILTLSDKLSLRLSDVVFKQGELDMNLKAINNNTIKPVGSARMKTEYVFYDGRTAGQEKGGFEPTQTAKDINWIITPLKAPIAVSKTDGIRVFDPQTNQTKRAYSLDYRKYHDIWLTANRVKQMWVNIK